ncbi:MAG: aldo/keto reductase, partial [Acutalibacteraceae bacterium]
DYFLENGFNYFDTARGYHKGKSEPALKEALTCRYPREAYILTDKLSGHLFKTNEDIRPLFQKQLETCGVDYFDFYLMHAQDRKLFEKYKKCHAYETAFRLKAEGKIKHVGLSFHDKAFVLEQILTEYPEIEVVQIQLNYLDYDDPAIEGRKCYEVCRKFNKSVIVMEPVKGGVLANIPKEAKDIFAKLGNSSPASYAIRFCAGFEGVIMVLSGMGNMEMLKDNIKVMSDFKPLNELELEAVNQVREILNKQSLIQCTGCEYCLEGCPQKIAIPHLFTCMNNIKKYKDWNSRHYYNIHTSSGGKASDCIKCGLCEQVCPQHLEIPKLLKQVAKVFDN